jgi:hypothetical protein
MATPYSSCMKEDIPLNSGADTKQHGAESDVPLPGLALFHERQQVENFGTTLPCEWER